MLNYFLFVTLLATALSTSFPPQNPIIGIFTVVEQPQLYSNSLNKQYHNSYFPSSYVKFIEMSGAQVVPLYSLSDKAYYDDILPKLNGIMFTGGNSKIDIKDKYIQNARYVFEYAMKQNDQGRILPIWGTCQGIQLLAYLTNKCADTTLSRIHGSYAVSNAIKISREEYSYLLEDVPQRMLKSMQSEDGIFSFYNHDAITVDTYESSSKMKSFWKVIGKTTTRAGDQIISIIEAKNYPFFGIQFHPQKNLFQWKVYVDRTYEIVFITQMLSNKFIEKARMSKRRFNSLQQFEKVSIRNYVPQPTDRNFTSIYVFEEELRIKQQRHLLHRHPHFDRTYHDY